MSKVKNSDPETFPLFRFRKLREPQQRRTEIKSLPLKELDYSTLVSLQKIVDGMMTRELRRNYPEAEIVAQILKNPAVVVDAGKAEVVEAVRERVRFNLQTRWFGR
jgi:7-keto-8-aminopelargonate synthetase-like enzyme